jgi:hypothetical protein
MRLAAKNTHFWLGRIGVIKEMSKTLIKGDQKWDFLTF